MLRKKIGPQPLPSSFHMDEVRDFILNGLTKYTGTNHWVREEFEALAVKKWQERQDQAKVGVLKDFDYYETNAVFLKAKLDVLRDVYFELKTKILNFVPYLHKLEVIKDKLVLEIEKNPQIWGEDVFDKSRSVLINATCSPN